MVTIWFFEVLFPVIEAKFRPPLIPNSTSCALTFAKLKRWYQQLVVFFSLFKILKI